MQAIELASPPAPPVTCGSLQTSGGSSSEPWETISSGGKLLSATLQPTRADADSRNTRRMRAHFRWTERHERPASPEVPMSVCIWAAPAGFLPSARRQRQVRHGVADIGRAAGCAVRESRRGHLPLERLRLTGVNRGDVNSSVTEAAQT